MFKREQGCSAEGGRRRERGELAAGQADLWGWQWALWAVTFSFSRSQFKAQVELKNTLQQTCAAAEAQGHNITADITCLSEKKFLFVLNVSTEASPQIPIRFLAFLPLLCLLSHAKLQSARYLFHK